MKALLPLLLLLGTSVLIAQDTGKNHAAPKYTTLVGQELSGSGFHFAIGEQCYLACSLHQFDGKAPAVMVSLDFEAPIKITGRVCTGKDTQVLTYTSADLDKRAALPFDPKVTPAINDKVYCYQIDEVYEGRIIAIDPDKRNCSVSMSKPYPAGGNSGSPVVSAVSGTVIGVLLSADDADAATTVGFERLVLEKKAE